MENKKLFENFINKPASLIFYNLETINNFICQEILNKIEDLYEFTKKTAREVKNVIFSTKKLQNSLKNNIIMCFLIFRLNIYVFNKFSIFNLIKGINVNIFYNFLYKKIYNCYNVNFLVCQSNYENVVNVIIFLKNIFSFVFS